MLLRPRQKALVRRALEALQAHGNTLAVAPTGSGKTIMLAAIIGELCSKSNDLVAKTCVVAHRDVLTVQNEAKFRLVNPKLSTSIFDARVKSWHGSTVFAMVQTLSREISLSSIPKLDLLVIDEAHHARADTYQRIIKHAQKINPQMKLLGMTATPNRGDKKGLRPIFSNVCDQIFVNELIDSGHLVRPRIFVMDVGVEKRLRGMKKTAGDYDMVEIEYIMNTPPINQAVVSHWKEKAATRQTVVFCSTVKHACDVHQCFVDEGIAAVLVYGEMSHDERERSLKAYETGAARVIVNVAILTEGWDHPPTSCVVLLRPSSYKSTYIQMVGRGLRTINLDEHHCLVKHDCVVLDFGTSTLIHGKIEQSVYLKDRVEGDLATKVCPECDTVVPEAVMVCPLCGHDFPDVRRLGNMGGLREEKEKILHKEEFAMKEVDILSMSNFMWVPVNDDETSLMSYGFSAWSNVFLKDDQWYAVGAVEDKAKKDAPALHEKQEFKKMDIDEEIRQLETDLAADDTATSNDDDSDDDDDDDSGDNEDHSHCGDGGVISLSKLAHDKIEPLPKSALPQNIRRKLKGVDSTTVDDHVGSSSNKQRKQQAWPWRPTSLSPLKVSNLLDLYHRKGKNERRQAPDIIKLLAVGEKSMCLAVANDWMNVHVSRDTAHKTKAWLNLTPSSKQLESLPKKCRRDSSLTRYKASALIKLSINSARVYDLIANHSINSTDFEPF
jgi:superfamily II DNA or RNA helicase